MCISAFAGFNNWRNLLKTNVWHMLCTHFQLFDATWEHWGLHGWQSEKNDKRRILLWYALFAYHLSTVTAGTSIQLDWKQTLIIYNNYIHKDQTSSRLVGESPTNQAVDHLNYNLDQGFSPIEVGVTRSGKVLYCLYKSVVQK